MGLNQKQQHGRAAVQRTLQRLRMNPPQMHDRIALDDAVEFLVDLVRDRSDHLSAARQKVKQRMRVAVGNGSLKIDGDQQVLFGHFINWAQTKKKWAPALAGLPALNATTGNIALPAMQLSGVGYALPGTIEECHKQLHDIHATLHRLALENARLRALLGET